MSRTLRLVHLFNFPFFFFREITQKHNAARLKLAMVEMKLWSVTELKKITRDLNLAVNNVSGKRIPVRQDYVNTLQALHTKERQKLLESGQKRLKQEQAKWKARLQKMGWKTLSLGKLRTYAKCMGLEPEKWRNDIRLKETMENIFGTKKRKRSNAQALPPRKKRRLNDD